MLGLSQAAAGPRVLRGGLAAQDGGDKQRSLERLSTLRGRGASGLRRRDSSTARLGFSTLRVAAVTSGTLTSQSSWHSPPRTGGHQRHARSFQQNDGLVYLRNFFSPWTFNDIREETARIRPFLRKEKNGTAVDRLGMYLKATSAAAIAFSDPEVARRLTSIVGETAYLSEYPLEYRLYPVGSYMDWHKDETLFVKPQYEMVYTVANTSDSLTEWIDAQGIVRREWTEPNSLIIIRADAVLHRVLPVKRGDRSILKIVYTPTSERLPSYLTNLATTYL